MTQQMNRSNKVKCCVSFIVLPKDTASRIHIVLIMDYIIMCTIINTYNAAGVSRRQDQNVTNFVKNVFIL